jgi:hypothetical protein
MCFGVELGVKSHLNGEKEKSLYSTRALLLYRSPDGLGAVFRRPGRYTVRERNRESQKPRSAMPLTSYSCSPVHNAFQRYNIGRKPS